MRKNHPGASVVVLWVNLWPAVVVSYIGSFKFSVAPLLTHIPANVLGKAVKMVQVLWPLSST